MYCLQQLFYGCIIKHLINCSYCSCLVVKEDGSDPMTMHVDKACLGISEPEILTGSTLVCVLIEASSIITAVSVNL